MNLAGKILWTQNLPFVCCMAWRGVAFASVLPWPRITLLSVAG
jgi:hypothetical protein